MRCWFTGIVQMFAASVLPIRRHLRTTGPFGDEVLVSREVDTLYSLGDEALYHVVDIYFVEMLWDQTHSWENDTGMTDYVRASISTGLRTREGRETIYEGGLESEFQGLTVRVDRTARTFTVRETTQPVTVTHTVQLEPRCTTTLYQRAYVFHVCEWFCLEAWREMWEVGPGPRSTRNDIYTKVNVEDYVLLTKKITGSAEVDVGMDGDTRFTSRPVAPWNGVTKRCREVLTGPEGEFYYSD